MLSPPLRDLEVNHINLTIRANEALKKCLPEILKNSNQKLIKEENIKKWHLQLLENLEIITDMQQIQSSQGIKMDQKF